MSFLFPSFLWALLGIIVPVIIHLFNFRRTRKIAFTNVAFLKNVQVSTNTFRRLKHLLVLLARIFFVVFLVLAFAQPFLSRNQQLPQSNQSITGIYLDNSMSMQQTVGNRKYLDMAVEQAEQLINSFAEGADFQLLTNSFENNEQFLLSKNKIKDKVTELNFSNTYRPADAINQRQQSLLKKYGQSSDNQFFWISDFQKKTLGDLGKVPLDTNNRYYLIPVQATQTNNVFVDSLWLTVPFIREMEANVLNVRLINTGKGKVENKPVKLFIDNRQISSAAVSIDANNQAVATFNFTIQEKGFRKARISFEDEPITFDNDYYFVLNAAPLIQVVHLFGKPDHKFVSSVFENPNLFKLQSLNAAATDPSVVNNADLVVLDELDEINGTLQNTLQEFVRKGGSVVIFPSQKPNFSAYNMLLSKLSIRNVQTTSNPAQVLAVPDANNPFYTAIFENTTRRGVVNMPSATPVLTWGTGGNTLLKYKNEQGFLSQFLSAQGKVYLCAAPLNLSFSGFAKHALFVPVMYKIAALSKTQEQMAYSFGQQ
ncbi:MAG: BatA domain-containing protein, partial [Verrucomicrobia bacterium]|nr:BatA domain-containing protein [Cytophagales bacterium]